MSQTTLLSGQTPANQLMVARNIASILKIAPVDTLLVLSPPKIADLRSILERLQFKPYQSEYVLALLISVDQWSSETATALLKILEEPPPQARLVLFAQDEESVLPTIRSRASRFRLPVTFTSQEQSLSPLETLLSKPLSYQMMQTAKYAEEYSIPEILNSWLVQTSSRSLQVYLLTSLTEVGTHPVNKRLFLDSLLVNVPGRRV
ncbi:hypothetical protein HYW32_03220 [Candidatus Berkelbacteria bacterium]|nr:hypothetical protein [Candidatus Berkelbacteria bacterium]